MKGLYSFYRDFGRMGHLEGTFIADSADVAKIVGKDVYFAECLGKHSEVYCRIKEEDIVLKTNDQDFIAKFEEILGEGYGTGYSPLDYYEPDEEDGEEEDEE